jgi:hypothetical protein
MRIISALLVVIALVVGLVIVAYFSLETVVKVAIEHVAPRVAGVDLKVADVQLSPTSGKGRLRGLEIGNPPGFSSARAAKLGEITVFVDPSTVMHEVIVIHEIVVDSPLINYERGAKTTNLDAIQSTIDAYVKRSGGASDGSTSPPGDKRRFIVDRISIRNAKVTMTNPALKGQGITFDIPDVELRELGRAQNGISASQVANIVATQVISRIAQKVLTNFQLLRKGGIEGAIDALKGLVK